MNKYLLSVLLVLLNFTYSQAQSIVYSENFDGGTVSMNSNGTSGWATDNTLFSSSPKSWRGQYAINSTSFTENILPFNTTGNYVVTLNFKQICKVDFLDSAQIQISVDGGISWNKLIAGGAGQNCIYNGTGNYTSFGNKFCEGSYIIWDVVNASTPTNTWWKQESFDISTLAGNQADVRIRFSLKDNSADGMNSRAGWYLDDLSVTMKPCEQIPPSITLTSPVFVNDIYLLQQNYSPNAIFTDLSGISSGTLYWTINSDTNNILTNSMTNTIDSLWNGIITNPNGPFVTGDTIRYWIESIDASTCSNLARYPNSGSIQFIIHDGISLPFSDNFDNFQYWTPDPNSVGSAWEIGVPTQSNLNQAHSYPNVMGNGLTGVYQDNTISYINSPSFDFSTTLLAKLVFWHNNILENNYDGVNIQYSNDNGVTWLVLGTGPTDPFGTNWYTVSSINVSNGEPVWSGNTSGWIESQYILDNVNGIIGYSNVIFRFKLCSDFIGNDEGFNMDDFSIAPPCPYDMGITSIVSPSPNKKLPEGKPYYLTAVLKNYSGQIQTQTDISYRINGGSTINFTWTGTINPGDTLQVSIPIGFSVPGAGEFNVCAWSTLPGDCNNNNDTTCSTYFSMPYITPDYCEDFESGDGNWKSETDTATNPNTYWQYGTPAFGQTNSAFSGTKAWDINLNSAYDNDALTYLYTPFFNFTNISSALIKFNLNWNLISLTGDGFYLEYSPDGGDNWVNLGVGTYSPPSPFEKNWYLNNSINMNSLSGWDDYSNGWIESSYNLCPATINIMNNPQPIQFRFVFISNGLYTLDGVSIDDFCITEINGPEISFSYIEIPTNNFTPNIPTDINFLATNLGTTTITSLNLNYTLNGIPGAATIPWTGTLSPCSINTLTIPGVILNPGINTICIYPDNLNDLNPNNDTVCSNLTGNVVYVANYCDDFESGNMGWTPSINYPANSGTNWEFGTPAYGTTNSAHSGNNAWDINLTSKATDNANAYLTSPMFDFSNFDAGRISFAINYNTEAGFDLAWLEYTLNNGLNWNIVGFGNWLPDPCGTNWYDYLNGNPTYGWSGNSGGWKIAQYKLCCLGGVLQHPNPIQFRFVFKSDNSISSEGFSMDDFCIYSSSGLDAGITAIISPQSITTTGNSIPLEVTLSNLGIVPFTDTQILYSINGVTQPSFTWTGTLSGCDGIDVVLPNISLISGTNTICVWTELSGDSNNSNDTICLDFTALPIITPNYSENFDNGNSGWYVETLGNPNTKWELGTPAYGNTSTSNSFPNAWDINLLTAYDTLANTILYSPFFDLSNSLSGNLSFWLNYQTEFYQDGLRLEYREQGSYWTELGSINDPNGINWFNSTINSNASGWSGNSGGWIHCNYNTQLISGSNLIQFRFIFTSDQQNTGSGVSLDDFTITKTVGLNETEYKNEILLYPNPVHNLLQIQLQDRNSFTGRITIFDAAGRVISRKDFINTMSGSKIEISTKGFAPGMYLISIDGVQTHLKKTFIKE